MTGDRQAGQDSFFFGELMDLRLKLGLSKTGLAEILGVSTMTIYRWESYGPLSRLTGRNAEMVDIFCSEARKVLEEIPDFGERFITAARLAQYRGVTHEHLLDQYRRGFIHLEDFGVLGLFAVAKRK